MGLSRTTDPASEPVTTAALKAHLRIDTSDEDTELAGFVAAARDDLERWCRVGMITQSWTWTLPGWPASPFPLPRGPAASITEILYQDAAGDEQTLATSVYELLADETPPRIALQPGQAWPSLESGRALPISIEFVIGVADVADVPPTLVLATKLLAGHYYENREASVPRAMGLEEVPLGIQRLAWLNRTWSFP